MRRGSMAAVVWGALIGALGGLVGLGGAEFRLPVLLGAFRFRPLDAVILNKALSLVVVAAALLFRTRAVPFSALVAHWPVVADLLAGSLLGAWFGAGWAIRMRGNTFYRVIAILLLLIAVMLLFGDNPASQQPSLVPWSTDRYVTGVVAGFGIGIVAALMGVAGGEFIIPTIVLLFGVDAKLAGSLSLAVSLPTMLSGFLRYSQDRSFTVIKNNANFVLLMAVGSVAGAFVGGLLLGVVPGQYLLPALALVLLLSAIRVWRHASARSHLGSRDGTIFSFEADDVRALTYMPLSFRLKLDTCAMHLSQRQWSRLALTVRQSLIAAPCRSDADRVAFRQHVARVVQEAGGGSVRHLEQIDLLWRSPEVPEQVAQAVQSLRLPKIHDNLWKQTSEEKRFAILRLTRHGHVRNLETALREFGLINENR